MIFRLECLGKKISFLARFVQRLQKYNYYLEEEKKNLSLNCLFAKNEKYTAQNMIVLQNLCFRQRGDEKKKYILK